MTTRILLAIVLPVIFAALGVLFARLPVAKKHPVLGSLSQGFGLVAGLLGAQWAVAGWPPFPPIDVTLGLPFLGLPAVLAGALQVARPLPGWICGAVAGALGLWFLLGPKIHNSWTAAIASLWLLALFAGWMLLWSQLQRAGRLDSETGPGLGILLTIVGTAAAISLVISHSALLAQLAGAVAAFCGVLAAISIFLPKATLTPGGAAALAILLGSLLLCGYFYATLPPESAVLLAVSVLASTRNAPLLKTASGWKMWLYRGFFVALFAASAVYRAYSLNSAGIEDYYDY